MTANRNAGESGTTAALRDGRGHPLTRIEHEHAVQRALCDSLERIADGLPHSIDLPLAAAAVPLLRDALPLHMAMEEQVLFPFLRLRAAPEDNIDGILGQVEGEHEIDRSLALEIAARLEEMVEARSAANPNVLGYLLRGFFETKRRHMSWENNVVLRLARRRMNEDDLRLLSREMSRFRHSIG